MSGDINHIKPYRQPEESKKNQVRRMFNNIAPHYDFLNHFLSAGMDIRWRKHAIRMVEAQAGQHVLDMATGTGDMAITLARTYPGTEIHGVDIAPQMLEIARRKIDTKGLEDRITFSEGDSENLPMKDNSFDHATVAFGVRNFEHTLLGLKQCRRVVKPGGRFAVLEFSKPTIFPFKQIFQFYFKYILPLIGRITSKDSKAYGYLFESVQNFPEGRQFALLMAEAGFKNIEFKRLTLGVCTLYWGEK